jgi:hypothetical protein
MHGWPPGPFACHVGHVKRLAGDAPKNSASTSRTERLPAVDAAAGSAHGERVSDLFEGDDAEPTAEERVAVEQAWRRSELLPPPWVVIDLSGLISPKTGLPIPAGTHAMIKAPKVWAARFADTMNRND